ncbi:MAG: metallophosphoesterase [Blastocatellia bacterium]
MWTSRKRDGRFIRRLVPAADGERPLRSLAAELSRFAKYAVEEATRLSVERVEIPLARLPKKLDGLKIVHLSDVHHSPLTDLEHISSAVRLATSLEPDLVVFTGDFVSHQAKYIGPVAAVLGRLYSRFGSFACLGNHDHWTDPEAVAASLENNGIRVLINEGFRFTCEGGSFWFAGVDDYLAGRTDLEAALRGSFPDEMKLLLAHNPVIFRKAVRRGVDLTLSGHTHGGQIRFTEYQSRFLPRRRFAAGLHSRGGSHIYVTRGIGTVVVPIRFQCPPEISLLILRRSEWRAF